MRDRSRDAGAPYEVRCARCDVTFPVETRTCIHCGGPTSPSKTHPLPEERVAELQMGSTGGAVPRGYDEMGRPKPGGVSEAPFAWGDLGRSGEGAATGEAAREVDVETQPPSIVRSLLNSLGALVWVVLLVIFSLARQCGD